MRFKYVRVCKFYYVEFTYRYTDCIDVSCQNKKNERLIYSSAVGLMVYWTKCLKLHIIILYKSHNRLFLVLVNNIIMQPWKL